MLKIKIILFVFLFSTALYSQGESVQYDTGSEKVDFRDIPSEVRNSIDDFFKVLIDGKIKTAFKGILKNSPILEKEEDLVNLVKQTEKSIDIYGQIKDYEPVNAEKATNSFIRLRYIGLHTKFPMRWIFTFYDSPQNGWILTNVKFDDLSEFYFTDE